MTTKHTRTQFLISSCIWLMLSSLNSIAFSQDEDISLPQSAETTVSYTTLLDKAEASTSSTEQINLCQQAINMLPSDVDDQIVFEAYKRAGIILYDSQQYTVSKQYLNKAITYKKVISDQIQIAITDGYLGWIASKTKQYDTAISHFKAALSIYIANHEQQKTGNTYNSLGAMHWYKRDYATALEYFDFVLAIGEEIGDNILIRKGLTNKGVVLNNLAQYNEALICLEKALELNQFEGDKKSRAVLLNNLGNINAELQQYDASITNYTEALEIYTKLKDQDGISSCYNNLGEVYLKLGNTLKALDSYQTSLNILREEGDSANIALSYVNIGHAHQKSKDYTKAISYYEKALKLLLSFNDPSLKAETYLRLGQTLMINQHNAQAKDYLKKAEELALSLNEKVLLGKCYNSLSDWHKQQNEFKVALKYKSLYADIKDEITDKQALESSARMEAVYKLLRKEEQISILEEDNFNKTESLEVVKNTNTIYITISIALLIIVIILILSYRARRKTELLLTDKNNELKQLNATKDKFFSIIAHDLKSPFSSLMGFAEMLTLNAETKNTKEVIEYSHVIHNSTKRLLGLVENLLQWSRTQIGTTEFKPSQIDISIQTHNIVSLLRLTAEEKDIVISPKIERNLVAWADENLYNTVLRNLLSNAIKFSRVGSVIYVTAGIKDHMIEVSVADSGVGIRQENLEKLFMVDSTFSTKGTFNEKGTGLGLVLCKEFVEINKGTLWADSELEKGSTFYFTVPLASANKNK